MPTITKQAAVTPKRNGKAVGVLDRIRPISFEDEGLKVLLYGGSGSGKTTLAGTFPGKILWIICSGGMKPGELRSLDDPDHRKKVSQVVLEASAEIKTIVEHIAETGAYATVVLDHVSGLQDLTLKEILGLEELPAQKSWGLATQAQYGQSTLQCKEMLRALLNLSGNVVIVAQERVFGGKDDGMESEIIKPTVGAAVTPSLAGWLNPACDFVLHMFKRPITHKEEIVLNGKGSGKFLETRGKGVEFCARTEPHDVYMTKFRVPRGHVIPEYVPNPTYDKLLKIIKGVK